MLEEEIEKSRIHDPMFLLSSNFNAEGLLELYALLEHQKLTGIIPTQLPLCANLIKGLCVPMSTSSSTWWRKLGGLCN